MSLINLASVQALGWAAGVEVDPLRFRANIYVEGLPAWAEDDWAAGSEVSVGACEFRVFKPIVRCVATHVNLKTGTRDFDTVGQLRQQFSRDTLGTYVSVARGGIVREGDPVVSPK